MPLIKTATSKNAKTGNIAQTYRSGAGSMYSTCPVSCALNPRPAESAARVDHKYLDHLLAAVPRDGVAFTYSHFSPRAWYSKMRARIDTGAPTTTINASCDTWRTAAERTKRGIPCVTTAAADYSAKVTKRHGVRFVTCPASIGDATCETCGGGTPLCARADRDYVIVFPAHGAAKKKVSTTTRGGCYASGGNVALHWRKLSARAAALAANDGPELSAWVDDLPRGRILRHHVAGDIGR